MRCFPVVSPRMKHFLLPGEGRGPQDLGSSGKKAASLASSRGHINSEHSLRGGDSSVELPVRCAGNSNDSALVSMSFDLGSSCFHW